MPIDPIPLEHDVVADALYSTDPDTVEPLAGVLTVTPANAADEKSADKHTITDRGLSM
jgi:hypothetical protein